MYIYANMGEPRLLHPSSAHFIFKHLYSGWMHMLAHCYLLFLLLCYGGWWCLLTLWLPYQLLVSCDSAIMAPVISCLQLPVILYHNSVQNENVVTHHCIIVSEGVTSLSFAAAAIPLGCSFSFNCYLLGLFLWEQCRYSYYLLRCSSRVCWVFLHWGQ